MRIGFVTGRWAALRRDEVWSDAGLGRLIDALAVRADSLTVAASVFDEAHPLHDHRLGISRSQLVPLPPMQSFVEGVVRHRESSRAIEEVERRSDVVIIQIPFTTPSALIRQRTPRVYHICADVVGVVRESGHYRGAKRIAAVSAALMVERLYGHLVGRPSTRIVAHGESLMAKYPGAGSTVVSSSLYGREIMSVKRRRTSGPFRVLFVGHLRPEKGFDFLIEAFERVRREIDAELVVIGPTNASQQEVADRLRCRMECLIGEGSARLLGPKSFGPELFQCYADADALALPSLSEGTPRVLLEARAFGCPVVASNVGGIPASVRHDEDGLLIPPADSGALAAALLRLARDPALRERLIREGINTARRHTLDVFADRIFEAAQRALSERSS